MSAVRTPADTPRRAGTVAVRLLGGFEALRPDGGVAAAWQRPSAKKLLSLLLLSPGRRLERSVAARLLFPTLTRERAANGLAKAAHWCREALGFERAEALVARGELLCWEPETATDVDGVLAVARSRLLPNELSALRLLADDDRELLPEWPDEWLSGFRDEVRAGRLAASAELATRLSAACDPAGLEEAVQRWRALVEDDPLDETRQAGLLRTLLAAGRLRDARAAYAACRAALWRELAVEPSMELDRLGRQADDSSPVHSEPVAAPTAPSGRTEVVAALANELVGAERGLGGGALVVGDAGIGKTVVLRALADHFRCRGWRVVSAVGAPVPVGSYSTLARTLRNLAAGTSQEEFIRQLVSSRPGSLRPVRVETAERALHRRIARLLDEVADLPTLVLVDDLHAADPATSRLVRELAALPDGRSWSVLAASRPQPALGWTATVMPLGPLPDELIEALVRARCGACAESALRRVVARAGGNPLFARELAALVLAGADENEVPASVLQLVRNRLAELPAGQRTFIPLVVLAGPDATWPAITRAAAELGLAGDVDASGAPGWLTGDLIVEHEGHFSARHPLVAEAALALLRRGDRAVLHDVLAGIALADAHPRTSARHRIAAFDIAPTPARAELALAAACAEAGQALSQGADEEAAGLARCALRAWSAIDRTARDRYRPDALDAHLALGHALAITHPAEAEAAYDNGFRAAATDDDRARFSIARGWQAYIHGDYARAGRYYQLGRELAEVSAPLRAALTVHQAWVFARLGLLERAVELCTEAEAMVGEDEHPEVVALAADRRGMALAWLDRLEESRETLDRAFELVTRVDDQSLLAAIQIHRGDVASRLGDFATSFRILDQALAAAQAAGDPYAESVAWWVRTDALTRQGDRAGALAASLEEERILSLLNNPAHLAACLRRRQALL